METPPVGQTDRWPSLFEALPSDFTEFFTELDSLFNVQQSGQRRKTSDLESCLTTEAVKRLVHQTINEMTNKYVN